MKHFSWDADLIRRYDLSGPRYTSYPTAIEFTDDYGEDQLRPVFTGNLKRERMEGAGMTAGRVYSSSRALEADR